MLKHEETQALTRLELNTQNSNQSGFSLLEMIVALGILIVLTVGGVLAYNGIQKNSREAAVLAAVKSVYTEAVAYDLDNDPTTSPEDAAVEYNNQGQAEGEEPVIKATVNRLDETGALCTVAEYPEHDISAVYGADTVEDCLGISVPGDPDSETPGEDTDQPNDELANGEFIMTWNPSAISKSCVSTSGDNGREIFIPISGKEHTFDVTIDWNDGHVQDYSSEVKNSNPTHCYTDFDQKTIKVNGHFDRFGTDSIDYTNYRNLRGLVSVDEWGETGTTNLKNAFSGGVIGSIAHYSSVNSVVAPPSTVTNMSNTFAYNSAVNSLAGDWDTSNVTDMSGMFKHATNFKQDISEWEVSKVRKYTNFALQSKLAQNEVPRFVSRDSIEDEDSDFIVTWTSGTGSTCTTTDGFSGREIFLPFSGNGYTFDVTVDWGDGTLKEYSSSLSNTNPSHCYTENKERRIKVQGNFDRFGTNSIDYAYNHNLRGLSSIDKWEEETGTTSIKNALGGGKIGSSIYRNEKTTNVAAPPSTVIDTEAAFTYATALKTLSGDWDTSNVTNMSLMFKGATEFNQDLSGWNVGKIQTWTNFAESSGLQESHLPKFVPHSEILNSQSDFTLTWKPGSGSTCKTTEGLSGREVFLPFSGAPFDVTVDWGNGIVHEYSGANPAYCYTDLDQKTIKVDGTFERFGTSRIDRDYVNNIRGLISVDKWGETQTKNLQFAFAGGTVASSTHNNNGTKSIVAPPSTVTNMSGAFQYTTLPIELNGTWNTDNVTNMSSAFRNSKITSIPIGWDTPNVKNMSYMFYYARDFNDDISDWNTEQVTDMSRMFSESSFDSDISEWDTSSVTNMQYMFYYARAFSHDVSQWNVDNVTNWTKFSLGANNGMKSPDKFN